MKISKRKELKLRAKYPKIKDVSKEMFQNWLEGNRDLGLCGSCPENIRGLCCMCSLKLFPPSKTLCVNKCTEKLRKECTYDKTDLPKKSKFFNVIMPNHPCKFLNLETKLCRNFENRFYVNRTCQTIKAATKRNILALPVGCVYLKGWKGRRYVKRQPKVYYESIESKLCSHGKMIYTLNQSSPHYIVKKY